jgi:hypothetical protein
MIRLHFLMAMLVLALGLLGCGGEALPEPADPADEASFELVGTSDLCSGVYCAAGLHCAKSRCLRTPCPPDKAVCVPDYRCGRNTCRTGWTCENRAPRCIRSPCPSDNLVCGE